jgi:hypothetical protein
MDQERVTLWPVVTLLELAESVRVIAGGGLLELELELEPEPEPEQPATIRPSENIKAARTTRAFRFIWSMTLYFSVTCLGPNPGGMLRRATFLSFQVGFGVAAESCIR